MPTWTFCDYEGCGSVMPWRLKHLQEQGCSVWPCRLFAIHVAGEGGGMREGAFHVDNPADHAL